jgi:hypothetical protein
MQLSDEENEEIERAVDAAFLRLTGKTYREPPGDSLAQIKHDFPSLFQEEP